MNELSDFLETPKINSKPKGLFVAQACVRHIYINHDSSSDKATSRHTLLRANSLKELACLIASFRIQLETPKHLQDVSVGYNLVELSEAFQLTTDFDIDWLKEASEKTLDWQVEQEKQATRAAQMAKAKLEVERAENLQTLRDLLASNPEMVKSLLEEIEKKGNVK